jgi:hypothetical protein
MKKLPAIVILCVAMICSTVRADERAAAAAKQALVAAIEKMVQANERVLRGSVSEKDKQPVAMPGGENVITIRRTISHGTVGEAESWQGEVEVWQNGEGETVITSRKPLPGFGVFDDGSRVLSSMTFEEKPFSLTRLGWEMPQLLDWERLGRVVEYADVTQQDEEGDQTVYRCRLSNRLLRIPPGGVAAIIEPKVLRIEATFTVDKGGHMTAVEFAVVRTDPLPGLLKSGAMSGAKVEVKAADIPDGEVGDQIRKALEGTLKPDADDGAASAPEGKTTIYRLQCISDVSDRSRAFATQMRALTEE